MSNSDAPKPLPADPYDGVLLENDVLGARIWGPPNRPTITLGASDIWDRRWFAERQPLVTLAQIRELAAEDRLQEVAPSPNRTVYSLYHRYDFPCPKPGAQLILLTPFAGNATVLRDGRDAVLDIRGGGKSLTVRITVMIDRRLLVLDCAADGLRPGDLAVRVYRHADTILPGQPLDPTLGGERSAEDFEPLPPPSSFSLDGRAWGIVQQFPADPTFTDGFAFSVAAALADADAAVEQQDGATGLGTPLCAEQEGRLDHGIVKRYTPINDAAGAAATATLGAPPHTFSLFATVATSSDSDDPVTDADRTITTALELGSQRLRSENSAALGLARRARRAKAAVGTGTEIVASETVLPQLRVANGYYGDVPMCSVGPTKFCFQDAGLWHADFHLNEIRAEPLLTTGRFEDVASFADLIRTLLPQAEENAADVYDLPGAMYPLVHFPMRCRGIAHTNLTWEQDIGLNGLVAKPLWLYHRYTGDETFLRDVAYPVLRSCAVFCQAYLSEGDDGRLHLVPAVSPEHWGLTANFERNRDCTSALTLTRYLLLAAADAADVLGTQSDETAAWRSAANRLTAYPTYDTPDGPIWTDVLDAPPIEYNIPVPLTPVFWGDDVGLDSPRDVLEIAYRTLDRIDVWKPHRGYLDSCIRPRLGVYRPEASIGAENLLQSYQSIRLFPAIPDGVDASMENFRAEGGFIVSATRNPLGGVSDVEITSICGAECRVANPWPGRAIRVSVDGTSAASRPIDDSHIAFRTEVNRTYRLAAE